jgi:ABC-2 type transport system permease protein
MIQSKVLLFIASLTPQRWAMSGMSQVLNYNGSVSDVLEPTLYLLIIAAVFLAISIIPFRRASTSD